MTHGSMQVDKCPDCAFFKISVATCTVPTPTQQTAWNISNMNPSSGVVTQTNTLTANCNNGWQFTDSSTSKVFTCTGLDTFTPVLEQCCGMYY